jgi:hypothetical protein
VDIGCHNDDGLSFELWYQESCRPAGWESEANDLGQVYHLSK